VTPLRTLVVWCSDDDATAFEPVVAALDAVTPRVEISRPGVCSFPTLGPSRWAGGDDALVARVVSVVARALGSPRGRVGIADGPFAARLAARAETVVAPGCTPAFLAPLPVSVLDRPDLADLLRRLGLTTLGDFAALPASAVSDRFGTDGVVAHRLAQGLDDHPLHLRLPPPDLEVVGEVDPPAERVDQAAFVAKRLADELHGQLVARTLSCTGVVIEAETEHGEVLSRCWRHDGALTPAGIADRARWQLDGWLSGSAASRPSGGLAHLRLIPDQVVPAHSRQLGFWGSDPAAAARAARGVARVQGMLSTGAVAMAEVVGGRSPGEQVRLRPVFSGDLDVTVAPVDRRGDGPWPGRIPAPAPAVVWDPPRPARLVDAAGGDITVDGRGAISASPGSLVIRDDPPSPVASWAGPWPADERWWDPDAHRRRARCQIITSDGRAHLLVREAGEWTVEASYD